MDGGFRKAGLRELSVVDERRGAGLRKCLGEDKEEGIALDLAVGSEARGDVIEAGVVATRVADELPCAGGGEVREQLAEGGGVEVPGGGDAERAVGGLDRMFAEIVVEAALKAPEETDLCATEGGTMAECEAPGLLEGVTYRLDAGLASSLEQGPAYGREEVGMLVRVDVSDAYACCLKLADLCEGLGEDVGWAKLPANYGGNKGEEGAAEAAAIGAEERRNRCGR